jgi:hypothetical protein
MLNSQAPDAVKEFAAIGPFLQTLQETKGFKAWQALDLPIVPPAAPSEVARRRVNAVCHSDQESVGDSRGLRWYLRRR